MNPIYFPFTYLPKPINQTLSSIFPKISVCQPSKSRIPSFLTAQHQLGTVDIWMPDDSHDEALNHLIREYHHWAQVHEGESPAAARFTPSKIPFFDESSSLQIRADITKSIRESIPDTETKNTPATLLFALAFLAMAQEFDEQQYELVDDFQRLERMQKNLFDDLKGDEMEDAKKPFDEYRPGHALVAGHMPQERINAWTRLFFHQLLLLNPENVITKTTPLLVTSSQSVMACLVETATDHEMALKITGIPMGKTEAEKNGSFSQQIQDELSQLLSDSQPERGKTLTWPGFPQANEKGATLSVYHVSDSSPIRFLAHCAGIKDLDNENMPDLPWRHTWIGVLNVQDHD